jgi:Uma2 family endonuclease
MVSQLPPTQPNIIYPDSDGQPMADNTKQFRWIVVIKENLEWLFADDPQVFVAGDLLWYPVEGNNKLRTAPDAMVVFGRPKGDRGSYQQWKEDHIAPQVVFEVLSPGNTKNEMDRKLLFYDRFGVEEYYIYDPDDPELRGFLRNETGLDVIEPIADWVSPRLQIRFDCSGDELQIFRPDGKRFLSYTELAQQADAEQQRADAAEQRANAAEQRADRLAEQLRSMGVDPDAI